MLKSCEKILSFFCFALMFVFISQLEANVLPFWAALSGVISCGGLSVILLMHGAELHFSIEISEEEPALTPEAVVVYTSQEKPWSSWLGQSKAA